MKTVRLTILFLLLTSLIYSSNQKQVIQIAHQNDTIKKLIAVSNPPQAIQVIYKENADNTPLYFSGIAILIALSSLFWPIRKESIRLRRVRKNMFYNLQYWKKGIEHQIEIFKDIRTLIKDELGKELPRCEPFYFAVSVSITGDSLRDIKSDDLLEIIVGKKKRKKDREVLLPRFTMQIDWANKLYNQIVQHDQDIREEYSDLVKDFLSNTGEIQRLIAELDTMHPNPPTEFIKYSRNLKAIFKSHLRMNNTTVEDYMNTMVADLRPFLYAHRHIEPSLLLMRMCRDIRTLHFKSKVQKQADFDQMETWTTGLKQILEVIEKVETIEFSKDKAKFDERQKRQK